jgi:CRP/FNR family transcriptional regulator, cyclic AMP receptor protein
MPPDVTRTQLLRRVWLFAELDDDELQQIARLARERTCCSGEVLVHQGEASGELFTVIQGRLKVISTAPEGDEVLLSVIGAGEVFGELALLDDLPRSATVCAVEHCRLLVVPRASFRPLLLRMPTLGLRLLKIMAGHVRRLSARTEDATTLDVRTRLAKTLHELAVRFGIPAPRGSIRITLRLSQQELGRLVGATREMINRCLRELASSGAVRHEKGGLTVLKPEALRAIAEGLGPRRPKNLPAKGRHTSKKRAMNRAVAGTA